MGLLGFFNSQQQGGGIKEYLDNGAIILDVRTVDEWNVGHSEGAQLITLQTIAARVDEIKGWNKPVIAVCKSGGRSAQATNFLKSHGIDVINGGPWQNVDRFL